MAAKRKIAKAEGGKPKEKRPNNFWAPFSSWWRQYHDAAGKRPSASEIREWHAQNAADIWPADVLPPIEELMRLSKGMRTLSQVKDYFRQYRKARKTVTAMKAKPLDLKTRCSGTSASQLGHASSDPVKVGVCSSDVPRPATTPTTPSHRAPSGGAGAHPLSPVCTAATAAAVDIAACDGASAGGVVHARTETQPHCRVPIERTGRLGNSTDTPAAAAAAAMVQASAAVAAAATRAALAGLPHPHLPPQTSAPAPSAPLPPPHQHSLPGGKPPTITTSVGLWAASAERAAPGSRGAGAGAERRASGPAGQQACVKPGARGPLAPGPETETAVAAPGAAEGWVRMAARPLPAPHCSPDAGRPEYPASGYLSCAGAPALGAGLGPQQRGPAAVRVRHGQGFGYGSVGDDSLGGSHSVEDSMELGQEISSDSAGTAVRHGISYPYQYSQMQYVPAGTSRGVPQMPYPSEVDDGCSYYVESRAPLYPGQCQPLPYARAPPPWPRSWYGSAAAVPHPPSPYYDNGDSTVPPYLPYHCNCGCCSPPAPGDAGALSRPGPDQPYVSYPQYDMHSGWSRTPSADGFVPEMGPTGGSSIAAPSSAAAAAAAVAPPPLPSYPTSEDGAGPAPYQSQMPYEPKQWPLYVQSDGACSAGQREGGDGGGDHQEAGAEDGAVDAAAELYLAWALAVKG